MMTTTHALVGALVGATTAVFAPELTPTAVAVGFVGGPLPDADLAWVHRRTLHFPVYSAPVAVVAVGAAAVLAHPAATLVAVFAVAAALHALMDVFGGGIEHRPWEATSDRGVYNHKSGAWMPPRRWVRYAGAPEDLLVASGATVPVLLVTTGSLRTALVVVLVASGCFVAVRRQLAGVTERLFGDIPDGN